MNATHAAQQLGISFRRYDAAEAGAVLVVVVPSAACRDGLPTSHHAVYDALFSRAAEVIRLDHAESTSESHLDASLCVIEKSG